MDKLYLVEITRSTNTFVRIAVWICVLVPEEDSLGYEIMHLGLTRIRMGVCMPTWCLVVMSVVVAKKTVRGTIVRSMSHDVIVVIVIAHRMFA